MKWQAVAMLAALGAVAINMTGCKIMAGVAMHPLSRDRPEYEGANPLGVVRVESDSGRTWCEHVSSIPDTERGYGLNMCGFSVPIYQSGQ